MKEAAYKGMVRPILEYMKLSMGPSYWSGRIRKGLKSCGKVCDQKLCL